jgi:protein gp37
MGKANQHAFQVFTKKSSRMRDYINARYSGGAAPEHIWLGAPVESGSKISRVDHVRKIRAAIGRLAIKPLIGPVNGINLTGI